MKILTRNIQVWNWSLYIFSHTVFARVGFGQVVFLLPTATTTKILLENAFFQCNGAPHEYKPAPLADVLTRNI